MFFEYRYIFYFCVKNIEASQHHPHKSYLSRFYVISYLVGRLVHTSPRRIIITTGCVSIMLYYVGTSYAYKRYTTIIIIVSPRENGRFVIVNLTGCRHCLGENDNNSNNNIDGK